MGTTQRVMFARIRFDHLLAPVLSEFDDAVIALAASRILRDHSISRLEVIPLVQGAELTNTTSYGMLSGATEWHAIRLLVAQGKLQRDVRLPVRILMTREQWQRAGLVAHVAEVVHAVSIADADRHGSDAGRATVH